PVERLRELKMRAVVGVREQDQFGVWQVLLQQVGIDGRDDDVVVAVDHERRVTDSLELVVAVRGSQSPLVRRGEMRGDGRVRDRDVAILGPISDAVKELAARGLALARW